MIYAGFWRRFAAYVIDIVILNIVLGLFSLGSMMHADNFKILAMSMQDADGSTVSFSYGLIGFFVTWIYFAAFQSSKHQGTLGMMVLGMLVCR